MLVDILINSSETLQVDLNKPLDISVPIQPGMTKAWHVEDVVHKPVTQGNFIGSIDKGSSVNFNYIQITPHGHGTHTECVGHITSEKYYIHECLKVFHFIALVISINPRKIDNGDYIIDEDILRKALQDIHFSYEALVIRTLPNTSDKLCHNYTGTNPPYFTPEAIHYINSQGVKHLLTDLPSVDKEADGGKLLAHKMFWFDQGKILSEKTITEMIYVSNHIHDGLYLLNLGIISLQSDASPSKPLLYKIMLK